METLLILVAVAACAVAGIVTLRVVARGRREPLRLDSEHDVAHEALLLADVGPSESPIDRSGAVLDLDPIREAPHRAAPGRSAGSGHREGDPR